MKTVPNALRALPTFSSLAALFWLAALAAQTQDFTCTTNNGAITITGYTGPGGALTIPDEINELPVTSIGSGAFYSNSTLTSVTIGTNLVTIGNRAFLGTSSLTNVVIGNRVTTIEDGAFATCALGSITIPRSVTFLGISAFDGCPSLTNATILGSVTNIGAYAFVQCFNLTTVTIPASVTTIGDYAFGFCYLLDNVTIPDRVTTIGWYSFVCCYSLNRVTIPDSIVAVGIGAFGRCYSLSTATIGRGVAAIGEGAFWDCSVLSSIYFRGNAPSVGPYCFYPALAAAYYLPGTTGWAGTIGGVPTVLWNAQIQISGPNFGVGPDGFGFDITGTADIPIVVEASTDLVSATWFPLESCALTNGLLYFSDPRWTDHPTRFYRIRSP